MLAVRNEKEEKVVFEELEEGYLVKVSLERADAAPFIGIYDGKKGEVLVFTVPGDRLVANTAGRMCERKPYEESVDSVNLIEILARDFHAVDTLFHALGVQMVYRKNAKDRIEKAKDRLDDRSGLNFVNWRI